MLIDLNLPITITTKFNLYFVSASSSNWVIGRWIKKLSTSEFEHPKKITGMFLFAVRYLSGNSQVSNLYPSISPNISFSSSS